MDFLVAKTAQSRETYECTAGGLESWQRRPRRRRSARGRGSSRSGRFTLEFVSLRGQVLCVGVRCCRRRLAFDSIHSTVPYSSGFRSSSHHCMTGEKIRPRAGPAKKNQKALFATRGGGLRERPGAAPPARARPGPRAARQAGGGVGRRRPPLQPAALEDTRYV